ncbi:PREDICTED: uncharacterized protein LOC108547625 [Eufriesea mexicana]|uniref:uncharacterized protein LOC108547625 n=1 Tax=Eufriesea mexicana TaxID=516756 RepID=UPI00083BF5B5|nr:PREDICTED: uncharacterized protein LOC108547625 [Eufriesea mexicana]
MDVVKKIKTVKEIEKPKSNISETKSNSNESKLNRKWSNKDKRMLLKALQKYGSENIEDEWLNCGLYKPGDSFIPEALLLAIYKYLYRSCFEQPSYFDLSPKDRDLLCFLLSKVEQKVWPQCKTDIWEYIGKVYNKRNIKRVYPGKKGYSS